MATSDIILVLGGITGAVSGLGALWLGIKKHATENRVIENEVRVEDVAQRVVEWNAINDRIEADNVRLRTDNDGLRTDNDLLRSDLLKTRLELDELRKLKAK